MSFRVGRKYKLLFLATIFMLGITLFIKYSDAFDLAEVTTSPENLVNKNDLFAASLGKNIFSISGKRIIDSVIDDKDVFRVDLDYNFPNEIEIRLNEIEPIALVYSNGSILAIDKSGFISEFKSEKTPINCPVITGAEKCLKYKPVKDICLGLLIEQLKILRDEDNDFYMAISSIDLTPSDYLVVSMDGLKPSIKMYAGDLYRDMEYLRSFLLEFNPDLSEVNWLDLRLEGQIIAAK